MPSLPKLPIGIQTFEKLRQGGYLYVDKTKYILDLVDNGSVYFLSRPRRFGKSLTVSTLDALFSGKRELFKGLSAEPFFDRQEYSIYPVISLDMSVASAKEGMSEFKEGILDQLESAASRHGVPFERTSPGRGLAKLIKDLRDAAGPVVILIDEYDKPMLDFISDPAEAGKIRSVLRDFYIQIKSSDRYVRFVFVTGITKFSRMGVFSAFNNLIDISMEFRYSTMLGYTEPELRKYFRRHIKNTASEMNRGEKELTDALRDYYDGFSFDGAERLFNPFSTLLFFQNQRFGDYWFETGTPSFLARYMRDRKLTVEQFRGIGVTRDFAASPGEIETATATNFLYQSGYLTLRPGIGDGYTLDYPNREVLTAMSSLLSGNILGIEAKNASVANLLEGLSRSDAEAVVREFNLLLGRIPYDDYAASLHESFTIRHPKINIGEWLYRSTLFSYLCGAGVKVEAEMHGHLGRADMVAEFGGIVWVMEIKIARGGDADKLADEAMEQILEKGYADGYGKTVLLGIAIDDKRRAITEYRVKAK
jgi:hypothetical protein